MPTYGYLIYKKMKIFGKFSKWVLVEKCLTCRDVEKYIVVKLYGSTIKIKPVPFDEFRKKKVINND